MRYLLFAGNDYYPNGGWGDFRAAGKTAEELFPEVITKGSSQFSWEEYQFRGVTYEWYQVVDMETMSVIKSDHEGTPSVTPPSPTSA